MLDLSKPIQTRDGRRVRILCTDAECTHMGNPQPIVGVVGTHAPTSWSADGVYADGSYSNNDLINVPAQKKKVQVEVRLYRSERMTTGLAAGLGVVATIPGETFGPREPLASATIEMEYEEQT
jgi:hypothetical protein